jgi:GAF domain-containing protein
LVATAQAIPFVGFGFMDNAILIIAGDAIDTSLGVALGISTLCAAAIGNIISDVAGIMMGTVIEDFCANVLKLPVPDLTTAQRQLRSVRFASQMGMGVGIVVGCIFGMFPLLFLDSNKTQNMKKDAHLESIFRDVVTEAKTLIGAESTCLYLRVKKREDNSKKQQHQHHHPTADGDYLYAMYHVLPTESESHVLPTESESSATSSSSVAGEDTSKLVRLGGRGIVSRAALTGEPLNIYDVHSEPNFVADGKKTFQYPATVKSMVVVPVLDAQGRTIAVIQAMNKHLRGAAGGAKETLSRDSSTSTTTTKLQGFTNQDVQILVTLASHISVSLQSFYVDADADEEMRLRDTIRILKEHGLAGIAPTQEDESSKRQQRQLLTE